MAFMAFEYRPEALAMTENDEGLRLEAYQDSGGVWTIGWGHTGPEVHAGLVWTREQCVEALQSDLGGTK
jgi:lysozyme